MKRSRILLCALGLLAIGHSAGAVPTPEPVRHAHGRLAEWQRRQAGRIECGALATMADSEERLRDAERVCETAAR